MHDFDALLIPGGHSPNQLCRDHRFVDFVRNFANAQKPIMSICHGPQLLIAAKVVKGRLMTTIQTVALDLINAGAVYYDVGVVNDNNLYISSRSLTTCLLLKKFAGIKPIKRAFRLFFYLDLNNPSLTT